MPHRDIHIDFNNAIDPDNRFGVSDKVLSEMAPSWLEVHHGLYAMAGMGQVQFIHLPYLEDSIADIQIRAQILQERFDTMVVLGIGGSALGAKAIQHAYLGLPFSAIPLQGGKKLHVLDTLDPNYLARFFDTINPEKTVFNVVSKSGNTVETMAQFLIVYEFLKKKLGENKFREHIILTTDPENGTLRKICGREEIDHFEILKGIGGRFSVLSPVGLLPAAFLGVPIQELAEGAIHMNKRCQLDDLWTNPAGMLALMTYLLSENRGRRNLVIFNYSENLRATSDWFSQLWSESLGKRYSIDGKEIRTGITPIVASGPRDQHSQVQLYVDGPKDKMVMFWQEEQFQRDFTIPKLFSEEDSLNYLGGKKISDIVLAEILASEQALKDSGVPNFKLSTIGTAPYNLGQLFFLLEVATVYVGGLLNVNPYDQPGVELGKKYLYGKLGRKGYEEFGGVLARKLKEKRYLV